MVLRGHGTGWKERAGTHLAAPPHGDLWGMGPPLPRSPKAPCHPTDALGPCPLLHPPHCVPSWRCWREPSPPPKTEEKWRGLACPWVGGRLPEYKRAPHCAPQALRGLSELVGESPGGDPASRS